jgi:hypothetical protein
VGVTSQDNLFTSYQDSGLIGEKTVIGWRIVVRGTRFRAKAKW